ncbi:MAG: hypothetical protein AB2799_13150 [Candidatus Thiodiazotropha sp.]
MQKSIRFGIGSSQVAHASTWKLWTETSGGHSEIYLACRALGGALKASMHQSGNWHIAFSKAAYTELVEGAIPSLSSRFADKWPQPPEIAEGVILAFRIVTPASSVTSTSEVTNPEKINWIAVPSDTKALEIYICITKPHAKIAEWPGKASMGTELIGSFALNNGNTVWAVSQVIDSPDLSKLGEGAGHFFKGKSRDDLKNADNLRGLVFSDHEDGSRVILDLAIESKIR